jgi:hypothetical protein
VRDVRLGYGHINNRVSGLAIWANWIVSCPTWGASHRKVYQCDKQDAVLFSSRLKFSPVISLLSILPQYISWRQFILNAAC